MWIAGKNYDTNVSMNAISIFESKTQKAVAQRAPQLFALLK
jgi:hypothetical protein